MCGRELKYVQGTGEEKPEGKLAIGRPWHRRKDNIKTDL
jgi:hypothetical protein